MAAFTEQVVFTPSEDQRAQAGVLIRPTGRAARPIGLVCFHGATGHFYVPLLLTLGRALAQRGYRVVSGNTRGHDVAAQDLPWAIFSSGTGPEAYATLRLGGEGWARWDEEPHDVAGWIDFLVAQGAEHVVLIGHSLGVARITSYQALRQDPRVVGVVLASGTDHVTAVDPARLELAERLVAQGQEDALLPVAEGVPMGFAMESAAHVVHWERHAGRFAADGHTPWIASIRVPVLATGGTADASFPDLRPGLEEMRARAVQTPQFDIHLFEGADHFYRGQERELADVVAHWLETLPARRGSGRRPRWSGRRRSR
jgi:pimeloyl-ACP methyl ester carboxylesterase